MKPSIPGLCALLTALSLAAVPMAEAATQHAESTSKTAKSKPAGKQTVAKNQQKKTAQPKKPTIKVTVRKKSSVSSQAIANARQEVRVARAVALPSTLERPGVQSSAVLVVNEQSGEVIYEKNADSQVPIASITKLMTAMVTLDARLPMNELITISDEDVDTLKHTSSRLTVGTSLTRAEVLLLALMSSENRAAAALSRTYPGGRDAFVRKMNEKAQQLGMRGSRFYDSTGLTPSNVSTPRDLVQMVKAAHHYAEIHQFSTSSEYRFISNRNGREMIYRNTNPLVKSDDWDIGLSKTGFINEAGHCIVLQATIEGTPVVMILMDSQGSYTRIGDANRVKKWLETSPYAKLRAG